MRPPKTPRRLLTEQLQAAQAHIKTLESRTLDLERTERFLRTVLEEAPDATAVVYDRGTLLSVNAQAERLFGYARNELLGQPIKLLLPSAISGFLRAIPSH